MKNGPKKLLLVLLVLALLGETFLLAPYVYEGERN